MADDEFRNCLSTSVEYVQTGGDEAGAIESLFRHPALRQARVDRTATVSIIRRLRTSS